MSHRPSQAGLSMIELMVALLLSTLLLLGLVQIFSASKTSFQMAQGLARVQETSRFALDYLQRDARLAGHFGCVNDQAHFNSPTPGMFGELFLSDRSNYSTVPTGIGNVDALRFDFSIQGFDAVGTAPGGTVDLNTLVAGGKADWSPELPASLMDLVPKPIKGSDVLILRSLSSESADITEFAPGKISVNGAQWPVLTQDIDKGGLFAIADCRAVVMFHATAVAPGNATKPTVLTITKGAVNQSEFDGSDTFAPGQSRVYRADSFVYYVGLNDRDQPSLYRARYNIEPAAAKVVLAGGAPEQLVDGVENMQFLFGQDSVTDATQQPIGLIENVRSVADLLPKDDLRVAWQRVGALQVGLLVRSTDPASAVQKTTSPLALGTSYKLPGDGRYRNVYEANIALRNRLFGN
ncbi:PilW family protein [Pseudomonas sp. CGJS7]|uniref:PilW family protein n=1 Tax=Pseudomonas sp. CGJS7 TaxID=3109348 RepID=UPI0030088B8B